MKPHHVALPLLALALTACGDPPAPGDASHDASPQDGALDAARSDASSDASTDTTNPDVVVTPTVSSWLGTNLSGDVPFVDITHTLSAFDTPAAQLDANGYPVAGASGTSNTDSGFRLPTGDYNISYTGDGTVTVSGIGTLTGTWQTSGSEHRNVLHITSSPGQFGRFLTINVANTSGAPVQNLRILFPGNDYGTAAIFTAPFLRLLRPFRALRAMDWQATNGSTIADWADRPTAARFGSSPHGVPYDYLPAIANETGSDLWVTIPEHATQDFVQQFARFLRDNLDATRIDAARRARGFTTPFRLYFEISNETWNGGFAAYNTLLTAARMDPTRYDGHYDSTYGPSWMSGNADLMRVGQIEADLLARWGDVFRTEFGARADVLAPVLSGWALGPVYSDVGLRFIQSHYTGELSHYVSFVAIAPYFAPDEAQTSSLDSLFAGCDTAITSMDSTFMDFARLAMERGVSIAAYEGGQSLTGTNNQTVKHLAQHDRRMHDVYGHYFTQWLTRFGEAPFLNFTLADTGTPPENIYQYGYWGSIRSITDDPATCGQNLPMLTGGESIDSVVGHCPKYQALLERVPR